MFSVLLNSYERTSYERVISDPISQPRRIDILNIYIRSFI